MKVTWLGHSAFLIEGNDRVLVDPYLTGNTKASTTADKVSCDIICVTHGHGDHLGDTVEIARRNDATVAAILEMSNFLERTGVRSVGFNLGGTAKIRNTEITMVPAFHSSSIGAPGLEFSAAMPVGLIINSGKVVYHAGDTCVFGDMKLIGDMYKPDLALLPIGGFFTMDPKQAAMATKLVRPKKVVPMHYGTWPQIAVDPKEFERLVRKSSPKTKTILLKPGESMEV
ncbi:MAG: metal-dependent hydrolase [Euryarchaeota archaeon RBG_19FT_COMBO_56_21]|nr:MAG: metal-dependent hydrolase [Euryarchaeota archaeon RBG_19FT_COMBO_56_21]